MATNKKSKTLIQVYSEDWLPHSCLFTDCHSRGFISESGVVFNFVQRLSKCQEPLNQLEIIKASRKYRSVIHSWYLKIMDDFVAQQQQQQQSVECENLIRQSKVLYQMEIAWHLCEILYINISSAETLLLQLLNWIKWHFTYYVKLADEMIVADLPQMHEHYWDIIMFFALRGDMENATLLLELHSESKTDPLFMIVHDLMKKFPIISNNNNNNNNNNNSFVMHEYYLRWGFWHDNVKQTIINQQQLSSSSLNQQKRSHQHLNLLLKLLSGDLESFKLVSHLFHSWYQMMVSYALFTDPCLKGDINVLIEKIMNIFYESYNGNESSTSPTMFDQLIRSAFNYDLIDVIKQSSLCFDDNWWFVTHFVDLIYNSDRSVDYQITDINLIRDSFVINYANALFSRRRKFWQLSIEYLIHINGKKSTIDYRQLILTSLERVPFDTEWELQRLLITCRRFDFWQLELSLYRQQAKKLLQLSSPKKLSSALFWAIRSKDKIIINHIVDKILRQYLQSTNQQQSDIIDDNDIIENIGSSIILSERLIFLYKYYEFKQLCKRKQYEMAIKILIDNDMITSNAIPDFFQIKVLEDCFQLIQPKKQSNINELKLNDKQICKLLLSLEKILYRINKNDDGQQQQSSIKSIKSMTLHQHQDEENESSLDCRRPLIQRLENKLRIATAYHLANHFIL